MPQRLYQINARVNFKDKTVHEGVITYEIQQMNV